MEDSKVLIACEFGYDMEVIQYVLRENFFPNAASLVCYLDELHLTDNFREIRDKIREEKEHEEREIEKKKIMTVCDRAKATEDLRRETLRLYTMSKCVRCRNNIRTIVCLPCSHYSLCKPCSSFLDRCPQCNTFISDAIMAFMV